MSSALLRTRVLHPRDPEPVRLHEPQLLVCAHTPNSSLAPWPTAFKAVLSERRSPYHVFFSVLPCALSSCFRSLYLRIKPVNTSIKRTGYLYYISFVQAGESEELVAFLSHSKRRFRFSFGTQFFGASVSPASRAARGASICLRKPPSAPFYGTSTGLSPGHQAKWHAQRRAKLFEFLLHFLA